MTLRIIKWAGMGLGALVLLLVVVGFCLPRRFSVQRRIAIEAPPEAIYPVVVKLKEWPTWTAWNVQRYPDMKITNSGPEEGVGARQSWEGDSSGNGFLEIKTAKIKEGITYEFSYDNNTSTGSIAFFPFFDGQTLVIWLAEGDLGMNPIGRYFGPLMDGFMGPDFETGLVNLKKKVELAQKMPLIEQVPKLVAPEK